MQQLGRYEVIGELGRGAMGVVYLAEDPRIGRRVAIKTIRLDAVADSEDFFRDRFAREATSAGQLTHPNIVTIYDYGEDDGIAFIAMEYVEGHTLDHGVDRDRFFDVMSDAARALDHAHSKGIVHRDIKPANIMVTAEGQAKIMDFGVAKILSLHSSEATQAGSFFGTPSYMSPEVIQGLQFDGRSDQYSLAVVAYEALTGRRPFEAQDIGALLFKVIQEAPEAADRVNPSLGPATSGVLKRALAKDPNKRYSTCREFAAALAEAAADAPDWHLPKPGSTSSRRGSPTVRVDDTVRVEPIADSKTRLFPTRPESDAIPSIPPPAPPEETIAGEHTQVFSVPRAAGSAPDDAASEETRPDVSLTITGCASPASIGRTRAIDRLPFRIGRGQADFPMPFDTAISVQHVELDFHDGGYTIRDLHSSNGTFMNGQRLIAGQPEPLLFGARIQLGTNTQIVFNSDEFREMPDYSNRLVAGRYTLVEKLHASGKSALYAARDQKLPQDVAIKILSPRLLRYPGYREQFTREAETASKLRHEYICRVHDYGETSLDQTSGEKSLFVCMDLMKGGSLSRRIASQEACGVDTVSGWLDRLCAALGHAHHNNFIHGGLKTSSIVFDDAGKPYLTDFALATRLGEQGPRAVIGSPGFLAPEQWNGDAPSPATDQYSLAVVAYLALTGVLPHEGQEHPDVRRRNFLRGAVPAHQMAAENERPGLPPALSSVLARALSVNASARFPTILDFALAFRRSLTASQDAEPAPPSVFISYHRASSSPWSILFKNELEREYGFRVSVDTRQRDTAGQFPKKLERRIQQCDVFVCILAARTLDSSWVNREIEIAVRENKPMVPIFQESFQPPKPEESVTLPQPVQELLAYDGIKLFDQQNLYIEAALRALADIIRQSRA